MHESAAQPARHGRQVGDLAARQIACLREFGNQVGVAFQLVDDQLGIWGEPAVTGKPVHSDLRNRKKSLPVVAALTSGTAAGIELAKLYARAEPLSDIEVLRAAELVAEAGGRTWARRQIDRVTSLARRSLVAADLASSASAELAAIAEVVGDRDH